jgi:hypothetical protein
VIDCLNGIDCHVDYLFLALPLTLPFFSVCRIFSNGDVPIWGCHLKRTLVVELLKETSSNEGGLAPMEGVMPAAAAPAPAATEA